MTGKRLLSTALVASLGVLGAASCSSSGESNPFQADPKEEITKALDNQAKASAAAATLSLDVPAETAAKFVAATASGSANAADGQKMQKLLDSNITYETKTTDGTPLASNGDPQKLDVAILWGRGTAPLLNFVSMSKGFYLKADANQLGYTFDASQQDVDAFKSQVTIPWLKDLAEGRWVGFDEEMSNEVFNNMKKATEATNQTLTAEEMQKISATASSTFLENATFVREGDFIKATVNPSTYANRFSEGVQGQLDAKKAQGIQETLKSLSGNFKPDAQLNIWLRTDKDRLVEAKLSLLEVANALDETKLNEAPDGPVHTMKNYPVNLRVQLSEETPNLNVPTDFTKVSKKDFENAFGAGL